jgi:hypothetical protein
MNFNIIHLYFKVPGSTSNAWSDFGLEDWGSIRDKSQGFFP